MALTGTLKDFGIADILQLIGQQAKSGVLHLKNKEDEVHVHMADGCVVSAEYAGRKQRERLGAMLVRAKLLEPGDVERALEAQQRSLRKLGDILVEMRLVTREDLKEITALQTTETVYRLFRWTSGTYQFEPCLVEWDRETVTPMRAEAVLMEGYRQVDEWPLVRRKIPSSDVAFQPAPDLAARRADATGLGPAERQVLPLAEAGRTVDEIAAMARLCEFEASKALLTLVNLGLLQVVIPRRAGGRDACRRPWQERLKAGAAGFVATVAVAALLGGLAWVASERDLVRGAGSLAVRDPAAQRFLGRYALARVRGALEVWRVEHGAYPESLGALVEERLVEADDLRFPYQEPYHYRRKGEEFTLLPPLP